ncbi:MAG TPA: hypothetical protein VIP11_27135 [Gemmatimonadaceae bacterium]
MFTLAQISAVAQTIIAVVLSVLTIAAIPALWRLRQAYRRMETTYRTLAPLAKNATLIGENLAQITTSIREDVTQVSATINAANDRIQDALAATEERVREFHALLSVAQEEAEDLFVSTASTVRGVRRGAEAFRERSGMDLASDELDAADPADDLAIQEEGDDDGDDSSSTQPAAQALPAAPRVRPRSGRRAGGRGRA